MNETKESLLTEEEGEKLQFRKCIVALAGLPLTGKSTLGTELARRSNFIFLDVNDVRWNVFPRRGKRLPDKQEQFAMQTSYQKNHERARDLLQQGKPVILTATYSRELYHQMLKSLAKKSDVPLKVFVLEASGKEIERRIKQRLKKDNLSVVQSLEGFLEVKNRYALITNVDLTEIDATLSLKQNIKQIFQALSSLEIKN